MLEFLADNVDAISIVAVLLLLVVIFICGGLAYWFWKTHKDSFRMLKKKHPDGESEEDAEDTAKELPTQRTTPPYLETAKTPAAADDSANDEEEEEQEDEPEEKIDERDIYNDGWRFDNIEETGIPAHDPLVEDVIRVDFKEPVAGQRLIERLHAAWKDIDPKIRCWVYAFEENSNEWQVPDSIGIYSSVMIIIQLASTKAVVDEYAVAQFNQLKQRIEIFFEGSSDELDMQAMVNKSKILGEYIKNFGEPFVVYLRLRKPVTVEDFGKKARKLGLKRAAQNVYEKVGEQLYSSDGKVTFNRRGELKLVYFNEQALGLMLNAPLVPAEKEPLKSLMMAANAYAAIFDAEIVDTNGERINGFKISAVKKDLDKFYDRMKESKLVPGSDICFRLFA